MRRVLAYLNKIGKKGVDFGKFRHRIAWNYIVMIEQTLGAKLQDARLKRGLSVLDAAHKTRIPAQRLQNLEADNYAAFGSMTYARAFVRQYSAFLGVSAEKTLEDLPSGVLGGQRDYRYLLESFGPWVGPRTKGREFAPRRTAARSSAARSIVPQALIIFALILGGTAMFAKHLVFGNEANMAEEVVRSESESEPMIVPAIPVPQSNEAAIKPVSTSTQPSAQAAPPDSIDGVPIIARRAIPTGGKGTVVPGLNQVALPPTEILND